GRVPGSLTDSGDRRRPEQEFAERTWPPRGVYLGAARAGRRGLSCALPALGRQSARQRQAPLVVERAPLHHAPLDPVLAARYRRGARRPPWPSFAPAAGPARRPPAPFATTWPFFRASAGSSSRAPSGPTPGPATATGASYDARMPLPATIRKRCVPPKLI